MKTCDVCGESIPDSAEKCPLCETPQRPLWTRPAGAPAILDIDVETGLPTVDEALFRLERQMDSALARGAKLLRVIHGRGSRGGDAPIRQAIRTRLGAWQRQGKIHALHPGEDYNPAISRDSRELQRRHPILTATEISDRRNAGITFVEL